jgi:hypothetical protein
MGETGSRKKVLYEVPRDSSGPKLKEVGEMIKGYNITYPGADIHFNGDGFQIEAVAPPGQTWAEYESSLKQGRGSRKGKARRSG